MTPEPHSLRCELPNLKELENRVRSYKQAGYQTFSIGINELLDIIDLCASHSSVQSAEQVLGEFKEWFNKYCEEGEEPDSYMTFFKAYQIFRSQQTKEP